MIRLLPVLLLAGCTQTAHVADVRQVAGEAIAYYRAEGMACPVDAASLIVAWTPLPGEVAGMVPWADTILLDPEHVTVPLSRTERVLVAHEVVHCCQIARMGRGPLGWGAHYVGHSDEAEAEAYAWARRWQENN